MWIIFSIRPIIRPRVALLTILLGVIFVMLDCAENNVFVSGEGLCAGVNDEEVAVLVDGLGAAWKSTIDELISKAGTLGTTLYRRSPSNIIIFLIFTVGRSCISGGSGCVDTVVGRVAIGDGRIDKKCTCVIGKGRKQG
jgi:hypothetical protein